MCLAEIGLLNHNHACWTSNGLHMKADCADSVSQQLPVSSRTESHQAHNYFVTGKFLAVWQKQPTRLKGSLQRPLPTLCIEPGPLTLLESSHTI